MDFNFNTLEPIIALILGFVACFCGYRLKRVVFFILWFVVGYIIMGQLLPIINENVPAIATSSLYQTLLPIAGGLLVSFLGFSIEKLCVGALCYFIVLLIATNQFGWDLSVIAIASIVGIIAGAFAVRLMKPAIILLTAVAGASLLATNLLHYATALPAETFYNII